MGDRRQAIFIVAAKKARLISGELELDMWGMG
jgi:hypothetical protein